MKLVSVRTAAVDRRYRQLWLTREGERLEARLSGAQMAHLGATFAAAGKGAETGWRAVMRRMLEAR